MTMNITTPPINNNDLLHCRTVESERIEYKESWNPEVILHTLCTFANNFYNLGGGYGVFTEQVIVQVSEQVMRLLEAVAKEPLSTKALLETLSLNQRPTFIQNYLQPALKSGAVEMTQPDSPRSPSQKYQLTDLGKQMLAHSDTAIDQQVTEQVMRLLEAVAKKPLSTKALLEALSLNHRATFIQNYLQPALESGAVEMTQPDSPRSPTQKYQLTDLGKQMLAHKE